MPSVRTLFRLVALLCIGGLLPSVAVAQTIVWTDTTTAKRIQKRSIAGGAVETILETAPKAPYEIYYGAIGGKLYFRLSDSFWRADSDGSNATSIVPATAGPFAVNEVLQRLYWTDGEDDVLNYSDLNGAGVQTHTYPTCCFYPLLAVGEDLYLGGSLAAPKGVYRADADGSNEQLLWQGTAPESAAYDPVEKKVYVALLDRIFRMNPDGTGHQEIVQMPSGPPNTVVAVDSSSRKLYWTDSASRVIRRSNLDGSNIETFLTASEAGNPQLDLRGLTVVLPPTIPASSGWGLLIASMIILLAGFTVLKRRAMHERRVAHLRPNRRWGHEFPAHQIP